MSVSVSDYGVWSNGSNLTYGTSTTGTGCTYIPVTVTSGGSSAVGVAAPRPQTALEWLDGEVEAVCRLARAVS